MVLRCIKSPKMLFFLVIIMSRLQFSRCMPYQKPIKCVSVRNLFKLFSFGQKVCVYVYVCVCEFLGVNEQRNVYINLDKFSWILRFAVDLEIFVLSLLCRAKTISLKDINFLLPCFKFYVKKWLEKYISNFWSVKMTPSKIFLAFGIFYIILII